MFTPADLAGTHASLQGGDVTVEGSGEDFTVNGTAYPTLEVKRRKYRFRFLDASSPGSTSSS